MKKRALFKNLSVILSLISVSIGLIVLAGWKFDIAVFKSVFANQITMKANTAMAMIICGISITFLSEVSHYIYKSLITIACVIVLILALLTLYQYIFQTNLGIDELLISDKSASENFGRMSPTTAFCFINIALAIFLSTRMISFRFRKILISAFSTTVIIIAGSIFLSYIPNIILGFHFLSSTSMGVHTSIALVLLALSLILFMYYESSFVWILTPFTTIVFFFSLAFILWGFDYYHNFKNEERKNDELILKTQEVLKELSFISINLVGLENTEYQYVISGDKQTLKERIKYRDAIKASLDRADNIIPNTVSEQEHINALKKIMQNRLDLNKNIIWLHQANNQNILDLQKKIKLTNTINQVMTLLLNDVDTSFKFRLKNINKNSYQEFLISPLSVLCVIFLLSLGIFTLNASRYERKKMDSMRNKLAAIVDSSSDGIVSKDLNGIVTSWNAGAEHIFGYTAEEIIGQPISILFPADRLNEEPEILKHIINGEKVEHFETIRKRKDGKPINVSVTISPLKDDNNKIIGASKIVRDITDNKRLDKQLRQSQKMSAIGQLSGGIAHDFNNLLGIIIGNLDLLERSVQENEDALKRTQTALKAATRGADLTKRLLAFSRQQPLSPKPSDLNSSVRNLVEMATQILGSNNKIETEIDASLPLVLVDLSELESALLNLAVNARDAMPNGGKLLISTKLRDIDNKYPSVQTGELPSGTYAVVSVTDTGHGIPPEVIEHVYEPFFTTKERGKGTGMGLSMVYGFAKQSGGTVKIYSEVDQGTTVTIYLPLAENIPLPKALISEQQEISVNNKVLVVDDEPDLLEIASSYLKELGVEVYQAIDAASAIEIFERIPDITLLITDVVMPGNMNGIELSKRIRQMKKNIKIIYVSGFPLGKFSENEFNKMDGIFLSKPYQRVEFINTIKNILGK